MPHTQTAPLTGASVTLGGGGRGRQLVPAWFCLQEPLAGAFRGPEQPLTGPGELIGQAHL